MESLRRSCNQRLDDTSPGVVYEYIYLRQARRSYACSLDGQDTQQSFVPTVDEA